jgi:hypothetical protein
VISNLKLQGSAPFVCINLLAGLCSFQVILNVTDRHFGPIDNVGTKDNLLSWLNPIEWHAALTSIQNVKRCHLQTLLVSVVVEELSPWEILVPTTLVLHDACSQHVLPNLVHLLYLTIHLLVVG